MSTIKNGQILLYCYFNKIIKEPGTSFQSPELCQRILQTQKSRYLKNGALFFLQIKSRANQIAHQGLLYSKKVL